MEILSRNKTRCFRLKYLTGWSLLFIFIISNSGFGGWEYLNFSGSGSYVNDIEIHPHYPDIVYVVTGGYFCRTTDGGGSWDTLLTYPDLYAFALDPTDPEKIITCSRNLLRIFLSYDGGSSWDEIGTLLTFPDICFLDFIVFGCRDPDIIYLFLEDDYCADPVGIWRSTDGGHTWNPFEISFPSYANPLHKVYYADMCNSIIAMSRMGKLYSYDVDWSNCRIVQDFGEFTPTMAIQDIEKLAIYVSSAGHGSLPNCVYKSTDWGFSWDLLDTDYTSNTVYILPNHTKEGVIFFGRDGISLTTDGGETFFHLNDSLPLVSIRCMALDTLNRKLYASLTDTYGLYVYELPDSFTYIESPERVITNLELSVYPNPFNSTCRIEALTGATVEIFDLLGNVAMEKQIFKKGMFTWQPYETVGSGIYLVRAIKGDHVMSKKVLFLK